MSKLIDLHVHSTASDGTMSPSELVKYAKGKGLSAIALTDHDTVAGVQEAIDEGKSEGLEVIPGAELSAEYDGRDLHMLGLYLDYKSEKLLEKLKELRKDREERNPKMIQKLNEIGLNITLEDVRSEAAEGVITRAHFAAALIKKGYVKEKQEAFERYIGFGCPGYVKRNKVTPKDAVTIIKEAGGIPILAHPCLTLSETEKVKDAVDELIGYGLAGIEVFHSDHSDEQIQFLNRFAKKKNLLISGGSDFHGLMKKKIDIGTGFGNIRVGYELLEKMKEYRGK